MPEPLLVAVTVHDLAQASGALAAAAAAGEAIRLESAPGAAGYLGAGYFAALIDAARAAEPRAVFDAVLDCGDEAGSALAALRMGIRAVRLDPDVAGRARVAAIAAQLGARLDDERPPTLDLGAVRDPRAATAALIAATIPSPVAPGAPPPRPQAEGGPRP